MGESSSTFLNNIGYLKYHEYTVNFTNPKKSLKFVLMSSSGLQYQLNMTLLPSYNEVASISIKECMELFCHNDKFVLSLCSILRMNQMIKFNE